RRLRRLVGQRRELREFKRASPIACDPRRLSRSVTEAGVGDIFRSDVTGEEWRAVEEEMASMGITEKAGGVNPGDRRAIYYLVRHFKPHAVLEVGTHIGASTVHIAAALRKSQEDDQRAIYGVTTVDIKDVNDRATTPWLKYGSSYSPAQMAQRLGFETHISFVTCGSLEYLASCRERYGVIFLDGDHA